ncbi:amidoligase family protein [Amaricoccus macauensis]|uniref:amidoligase family protein n=1 Tax=Amaricoccus macauensis TaxID=57001 RepID=UPI003C7D9817
MHFELPKPDDDDGKPRRVGVEIELGGLNEQRVAEIAVDCLGGTIEPKPGNVVEVVGTAIGDLDIYLDTAFKAHENPAVQKAVEMGRSVIPVEIVTDPIPHSDLPELDRLVDALREAGGKGTEDHPLNGYGVHFNVAVAAMSSEAIVPIVRAFALLEDWLRSTDPIDFSRRILPFVDRYPRAFLDAAASEGANWDLSALLQTYLRLTPSRNRALDLLPLLREMNEDAVVAALGSDAASSVNARPTFHYRLPDSRVGDPNWSLAHEWNSWCLVEQVAARPDLLESLAAGWRDYRAQLTTTPRDWVDEVDTRLRKTFGEEAFQ